MNTSVLYLEKVQSLFDQYRRGELSATELETKRNELLSRSDDPCFDSAWQRTVRWGGYALGKASLVFAAGVCSITLLLVLGAANLAPIFADDEPMEPFSFTTAPNAESQKVEDLLTAPDAAAEEPVEIWEI